MTNEELQAHIDAIRSELDAGTVECYAGKPVGWVTDVACRTMLIDSTIGAAPTYRIKPKPRDVWIHEHDIGNALRSATESHKPGDSFRKFREVLE